VTIFLDLEDALSQIEFLGFHVRDIGLVEGCLARPKTSLFGDEAYPSLSDKAAALMHSVATSHPLIDGNKRSAWALMVTFLAVNEWQVVANTDDAFEFVLHVAQSKLDVPEISAWIHQRLAPLE
jgi:death-on-curing protein